MKDPKALAELKALHLAEFLSCLDEAPPGSPAAVNSKTQTLEQAAEGMWAYLLGSFAGLLTAHARNQMAWSCSYSIGADIPAAMKDPKALDKLKAQHLAEFLSCLKEAPLGSPAAVKSKTQTPEQAAEGMWAHLLGTTKAREYFYI